MKVIIEETTRSIKTELTDYIRDKITDQYSFDYDEVDKLEVIANRQADVTARLIESLVEKGVINLDDVFYIANGYPSSVDGYLANE